MRSKNLISIEETEKDHFGKMKPKENKILPDSSICVSSRCGRGWIKQGIKVRLLLKSFFGIT